MESDIYPNATFKGKIDEWDKLKLSDRPQEVTLSGTMTIHGVSNTISEKGTISKKNKDVIGKSKFQIKVADYNIQIPKLVREKIAKAVDVDGHRRPRTQVGELLPPLLHPVALGRRLLLEIGLERLALAALALKVGDDRGRVVVLVVRQQRPHGGEVALARCERRIKGDTA